MGKTESPEGGHLCGNTGVASFLCVTWHVFLMNVFYCLSVDMCPGDGLENTLYLLEVVLDRMESETAMITRRRQMDAIL